MKSFTLDGKRHKVHPKVPLSQVKHMMGNTHVGTPDNEVNDMILERTTHWPNAVRVSASRLALFYHRKNQQLVTDLRL